MCNLDLLYLRVFGRFFFFVFLPLKAYELWFYFKKPKILTFYQENSMNLKKYKIFITLIDA
jgi:hypothetical protein